MKKFEAIDYLMIFAIIFFMFIGTISVIAQNKDMGFYSSNENIYGTWSSWDGSTILYMNYNDNGDTFYRISKSFYPIFILGPRRPFFLSGYAFKRAHEFFRPTNDPLHIF